MRYSSEVAGRLVRVFRQKFGFLVAEVLLDVLGGCFLVIRRGVVLRRVVNYWMILNRRLRTRRWRIRRRRGGSLAGIRRRNRLSGSPKAFQPVSIGRVDSLPHAEVVAPVDDTSGGRDKTAQPVDVELLGGGFVWEAEPDHGGLGPCHGSLRPSDGGFWKLNPATGVMDPATGVLDPPMGVLDPSTGVLDPATWVLNPATGIWHPASGVLDPAMGVLDPSTGVLDPATGVDLDCGIHALRGLCQLSGF